MRRLAASSAGATALIAAHRRHHPKADLQLLRHAYERADQVHAGQVRKSGEPYISHPLAVAMILADVGMDTVTLAAALLHDTVEDTGYLLGHLQAEFGTEVAVLVDGVTKLDGATWGDQAAAETWRKMIITSAGDLRVLVIKLADRLHNLRTLGFHSQREKRERIARASQEVLIPLAERLSIYVFRREMQDLCFAALQPEAFDAAKAAIQHARDEHAAYLENAAGQMQKHLRSERSDAIAEFCPRHIYSVASAFHNRIDNLRAGDVCRLLIVVNGSALDCYRVLGSVHGLWRPVGGAFRDFIAAPKFGYYSGLHTAVTGPGGQILKVLIRTSAMHRVAELGVIAQVADAATVAGRRALVARRTDLEWLHQILGWQAGAGPEQFMDGLRAELKPGGVAVFTPAGEVVSLPSGASVIDFAYAVDTELGSRCVGALVNGNLAPLSARLSDGQAVKILTDPSAVPSPGWLDFARTGQARVSITRDLAEVRSEQTAADGRRLLAAKLAACGVELLDAEADGTVLAAARRRGYDDLDVLYASLKADVAVCAAVIREVVSAPSW